MMNRTVVGWDGSGGARNALDWAVARELCTGGTLELVRVVDNTRITSEFTMTEATISNARRATDQEGERLIRLYPSLTVNVHVVLGDPYVELLRFTGPDALVVVGTERRHGARTRYRWSLGARLAAQSRFAVAVTPPPGDAPRHGIVAGFDGSDLSSRIVEVAVAEAERASERLTVVHAWQEPMADGRFLEDDKLIVTLSNRHHDLLTREVDRVRVQHPHLRVEAILVRNDPIRALLNAGRTASLVVVGNHRLDALSRVLLGSVAHSVILGLDSPVLVAGPELPGFLPSDGHPSDGQAGGGAETDRARTMIHT